MTKQERKIIEDYIRKTMGDLDPGVISEEAKYKILADYYKRMWEKEKELNNGRER